MEDTVMQTQPKPMAIKLPQQDRDRLKKLGEAKNRSVHWLAKVAISQFLAREEAAEQFRQETLTRWEEHCQTGACIPNDAVISWLDTWGTDAESEPPRCK